MKKLIRKVLHRCGYVINRYRDLGTLQSDFAECDPRDLEIVRKVQNYTMTDANALINLLYAVQYVVRNRIPGDVVECGVARGGSMMAAAYALRSLEDESRMLYLYDIFYPGMPRGGAHDFTFAHVNATAAFESAGIIYDPNATATIRGTVDEVRDLMKSTDYPESRMKFVVGKVEETIPAVIPDQIALLRLDTDLYESTRHELEQLYPRLSPGGVLIVDDYGTFLGARKATDEYLNENGIPLFLLRVGAGGCRFAVKPGRSASTAVPRPDGRTMPAA
jgi:O-methyltransferase